MTGKEKSKMPTPDQIMACGSIKELKEAFETLSKVPKTRKEKSARGHAFEALVARMLELSGVWENIECNFKKPGEEFDVKGIYQRQEYIFEVKWEGRPIGPEAIQKLESRMSHRPGVRGIIVTVSGATDQAIEWAHESLVKERYLLIFGDKEIETVLSGEICFNYLLEVRLGTARMHKHPCYCSVEQIIEELIIPDSYRSWINDRCTTVDTDKLMKGELIQVGLRAVYLPLYTDEILSKKVLRFRELSRGIDGIDQSALEPINIEELIANEPSLLLEGVPGSGKTTMMRHLAREIMEGTGPEGLNGRLPVLVFLSEIDGFLCHETDFPSKKELVLKSIEHYFSAHENALPRSVLETFCRAGRAVLLLDGLDELRAENGERLANAVREFQKEYPLTRVVLTSRPHAVDLATPFFGERHRKIHPLMPEQKRDFIHRWFDHLAGRTPKAKRETARELSGGLDEREYLSKLADTPLMLTAICMLYIFAKRLPEHRVDLYNGIVENLVGKRFESHEIKSMPILVKRLLGCLAFWMMERRSKTIGRVDAIKEMERVFPRKPDAELPAEYELSIGKLFDGIEPQCGLLGCEDGSYSFNHLSFQEFLAAVYLMEELEEPWFGVEPMADNPWWRETVLLYIGLLRTSGSGAQAKRVIKGLMGNEGKKSRWLLAAQAVLDTEENLRDSKMVHTLRERLSELMRSDEEVKLRLEAGEALGWLGDLRLEGDNMVLVKAGKFLRGSKEGEGYDDERSQRKIHLDAFEIGKYPVTNREFREFVDAGGYVNKEHWSKNGLKWRKEEEITEPLFWNDRKWSVPNFPVVGVSWYEADVYCRWLSEKEGTEYRLPTEAEWEKAARGTDGRTYPWGEGIDKGKCNYGETGLDRTSPVGMFPRGDTDMKISDMSGNVREWCSDWFEDDYYKSSPEKNPTGPERGSYRVIRGGGYWNSADYCRCAYRDDWLPDYRDDVVGFRVARSS